MDQQTNESAAAMNIREMKQLDSGVQQLIEAAVQVRKNAYCPYSNFAVGAAIRGINGKIYTGCNIENAGYSQSICAERSAIAKAVSDGEKTFTACAVVAYKETCFVTPCGTCRQVLSEFAKIDFPVYMAKPAPLRVMCSSVFQLLPFRFDSKDE